MAVSAAKAQSAPAEIITETADGDGYNLPEVGEISLYTAAKCGQLADELVGKGLLEDPIPDFAKLSLPDKRVALTKVVGALTGEGGGGHAPAEPPAGQPQASPAPETTAQPTQVDLEEAIAEKDKAGEKVETKVEAKVDPKPEPETVAAAAVQSAVTGKETKPKAKPKAAEKKPADKSAEKKDGKADGDKKSNVITVALGDGIPADDPIAKFAARIEKVGNRGTIEELIRDETEGSDFSAFKIGGGLARLQANPAWWNESYASFQEYIESVLGMKYRKAMYQIEIYRKILMLGVPYSAFGGLGWTKVLHLLKVVSKENIAEWVEKAKHMTALALEAHVEAALKKDPAAEKTAPSATKTMTFKVHSDQGEVIDAAIVKAMQAVGSETRTVGLEAIAQEYLGSGIKFADWKQALSYSRKHSDQPEIFVQDVITFLEEQCPELVITAQIESKDADNKTL
jgi:hypothetical protein